MRIATFNIQHGRPARGGVVDPTAVGAAVASLGAEIVGLQEVDRRVRRSGRADLIAVAAEAADAAWVFARTTRIGRGEYGNGLLVRGAIDDVEVVRLPRVGKSEPRAAVLATATVQSPVSVAVTHLGLQLDESRSQLRAVLDALMARKPPRILLGDLNMLPFEVERILVDAGMTRIEVGDTHPALRPMRRIDHIAVDDLTVEFATTVKTRISDHLAVVADVEL